MSHLFNDLVGLRGDSVDAFGRARISTPFTLFDSTHRYQENPFWSTMSTTGGTKTHLPNESAIDMTVTSVTGSSVIRETKKVFPYQPGKSLLVLGTFVFAPKKTNLRQRLGYFGTQNGVYLEQSGNDVSFVLRSYVNGSVNERRVLQADWSHDSLLGDGRSGVTIDLTKANILWMDIEWLGVGDVRIGFFVDGRPVVAHIFQNENLNTTTYMTTATLPLRYEIENLGTTPSPSTLKQICNSVVSEGGYEGFTRKYNITKAGASGTSLATARTEYPMIAIRLNSSRLDSVVIPAELSVCVDELANNKPTVVQYKLLQNPSLSGGSWITHVNGTIDYNITPSSVTGGTDIFGGYISSNGSLRISQVNDFNFQLGRSLTGVSDTLVLTLTPTVDSTTIFADLTWYEVT